MQGPAQRDDRPAQLDSRGPARPVVRGRRRSRLQHARRPRRPSRRSTRMASACRSRSRSPNATVKEKRGEVYVNVGKNLSPALRIDGGVNYEFSNLKVRGDAHRRPDAQVPEAEPDARLEAGRRLAHPVFGPAHRRAARFLRLHQRRRPVDQPGQRRQRRSPAAAQPGNSGDRRASACSATACSSSTSGTISSACFRTAS